MPNFGPYGKTIAALVTGLIGWATTVTVSASSSITSAEWVQFGTVWAVGFGVFQIANAVKSDPAPITE
jgi:predicted RecA/RadA family phage recombinase